MKILLLSNKNAEKSQCDARVQNVRTNLLGLNSSDERKVLIAMNNFVSHISKVNFSQEKDQINHNSDSKLKPFVSFTRQPVERVKKQEDTLLLYDFQGIFFME